MNHSIETWLLERNNCFKVLSVKGRLQSCSNTGVFLAKKKKNIYIYIYISFIHKNGWPLMHMYQARFTNSPMFK